ncbi:hypothetical protein H6F50_09125 [Coleofasciculus sp. FACHB-712]|uniref:hypothetical protein n=1 Tax=Coleofasciculus sp. FACHB-712 TaxID=2692789 RepID=UPI0016885956|nr:hypothetical protein [Coleofasciculus sp. FACHB-712]MBD1942515.1 hypothetical protein [Coleofasciculus sp. FACHB-712]
MKLKTSHILLASAALILLSNGERVRGSLEKSESIRQEQSSFNDYIRQNRTKARMAEKLSKVALDRYRNNCILVRTAKTTREDYFSEGTRVMNPRLSQTLRPGAFICNSLGDTAIVSDNGTITDIARITMTDQEEFKQLLSQR